MRQASSAGPAAYWALQQPFLIAKQQTARSQGQSKAPVDSWPFTNLQKQEHAKVWIARSPLGSASSYCHALYDLINKSLSPLPRQVFHRSLSSTNHPRLFNIALGHMLHLDRHSASRPCKTAILVPMISKRKVSRLEMAVKYTQIMHYPTFFLPKPNFVVLKYPNTPPQVPRGQVPYTYTRHSWRGNPPSVLSDMGNHGFYPCHVSTAVYIVYVTRC